MLTPPKDGRPRSGKLQFPLIAMLGGMSAIALLAAATGRNVIAFHEWPPYLLEMLMATAAWLLIRKAWFTAFRISRQPASHICADLADSTPVDGF